MLKAGASYPDGVGKGIPTNHEPPKDKIHVAGVPEGHFQRGEWNGRQDQRRVDRLSRSPERTVPARRPCPQSRLGPLGRPGERARDRDHLETGGIGMAGERSVGKEHEMVRHVPLIPRFAPEPAAVRGNVRRLADDDAAGHQRVAQPREQTLRAGDVLDHVKLVDHAHARGRDMIEQILFVAPERPDTLHPKRRERPFEDVRPCQVQGAAGFSQL